MRPIAPRHILALAALPFFLSAPAANTHPHIFAEARLDVAANAEGQVEALRHVWRFDDLFSSTVLVEFDADKDLELSADELREVANVVHGSLAEYNYFQLVSKNGKDVEMQAPDRLIADFTDNQLIILFESAPKAPLKLDGTLSFGVYDPTFYTAIDFAEDAYIAVENMPEQCNRKVIRPDADEALSQNQETLTEDFFNDPSGNDLSKIFATRLEITCSNQG